MGRNSVLQLLFCICFASCILSFNIKQFISSFETSFIKEEPKHSLNFAQSPEALIQKAQPTKSQEQQLAQVSRTKGKVHQEIQEPKFASIMQTMNGLTEVKNSCTQLIQIGEQTMEKDYQQCLETVTNFNCSYSEEWKYLKSKHKQNITIMEEEIKVKEETITMIKSQVQKKSENKNSLIKEILPEISQIEKDIGQLELILELVGEAFDKSEQQPQSVEQAPPQILVKTNKKTVEHVDQELKIDKKEEVKKEQSIEQKEDEQLETEKVEDESEKELQELIKQEKQQQSKVPTVLQKPEKVSAPMQQTAIKNPEQANQVKQQVISTRIIANAEQQDNLFGSADEAVENIDEQFDQENMNDLLDDIQNRNLFDDAHIFVQTKMKMKNPEYSLFEKPHEIPTKSLTEQILHSSIISDEDKESLLVIANEENQNNLNFESYIFHELKTILDFIQRNSMEQLQNSLDITLIRSKIVEQQQKLVPMMKTKLMTLLSQLKTAKQEKENQIKTLEELIQSEYQVYAQKIFQIQVDKHKLVEEIQKKQDWINQLDSKITDCENQDLMLTNCENAKEQDISYLKELEDFRAIAEGSLEQLKYLLDYKNVPIVAQKVQPAEQPETVKPTGNIPTKQEPPQPTNQPEKQPETAAAQEASKEAAKQEQIDQAQPEIQKEEAPKEEEVPKEEAPKEEVPKEEVPKEEVPKEEEAQKEEEAPKEEEAQKEEEAPKEEEAGQKAPEIEKESPTKEESQQLLFGKRLNKTKKKNKKSVKSQLSMIQQFDESPFDNSFDDYYLPENVEFDDDPPFLTKLKAKKTYLKKKLQKIK